ncbi:MAG: energy-coupling factor ABC transporter permease [Patescibacteria group bacterium]
MHLPDGFIDTKIAASFLGAALTFGAFSIAKIKKNILVKNKKFALVTPEGINFGSGETMGISKYGRKLLINMVLVGSYIFVMQMVDFELVGGQIGHFLGGALAGILLGPFAGMIVISIVLAIQAFFMADGGMIALGLNIVNMAVIGAAGGYYIFTFIRKSVRHRTIAVLLAVFLSVVLAAFAYELESMMTGAIFNPAFIQTHMIVGLAEGFITLLMLRAFNFKE